MQVGVGLLNTDVMPMFMISALDVVIIMRSSINCSAVICSPTVLFTIIREATSETYVPRVYFTSYKFMIYNYSLLFTLQSLLLLFTIKIPKVLSYHIYQISLS